MIPRCHGKLSHYAANGETFLLSALESAAGEEIAALEWLPALIRYMMTFVIFGL
jgi:hypothetical protein